LVAKHDPGILVTKMALMRDVEYHL